jgi:hypothetical protein
MPRFKIKKVIQIAFIAVVAIAVLDQAADVYLRWRGGRRIRADIWRNAHVAVIKTDPRFPPGLLLEYENASRYPIDKTRFQLSFALGVQEVATTERDFREMRPGEKEHVLLKSVEISPSIKPPARGTRLTYHLLVYPGQRKPLPEVTGEVEIQ